MEAERIRELTTFEEFLAAFPLIEELNDLTEAEFRSFVPRVREEGYRLFALFRDDEIVGVVGIKRGVSFSSGEYVYIDDLVTRPGDRSKGYGTELVAFVEEWARSRGCQAVRLVASTQRTDAHRFYEALDYERRGFYFKKELAD